MALQGAELRMLLSQCCVCFGAGMLVTLQGGAARCCFRVTLQGDRGTCPPKSPHHSDSSDSSTLQRHPSAALCMLVGAVAKKAVSILGIWVLLQGAAARVRCAL